MSPDLEYYALDGFEDWYKGEFGVELLTSMNVETVQPVIRSITPFSIQEKVYKTEYLTSGNPNRIQQEVINKLASILVDMVIDERAVK